MIMDKLIYLVWVYHTFPAIQDWPEYKAVTALIY